MDKTTIIVVEDNIVYCEFVCNMLAREGYRTVKAADPTLRFGISPQGNPDNDLDQQYSDVTAWLAAGGEEKVDRKSTRLNSSHKVQSRMPSSA